MYTIERYQFGNIIISGSAYQSDIVIFPDHIQDHWWREKGHQLTLKDLENVIDYHPDVLYIGTGMYGLMRVDRLIINQLQEKCIKHIFFNKTNKICEEYNKEKTPNKIAALHLTC